MWLIHVGSESRKSEDRIWEHRDFEANWSGARASGLGEVPGISSVEAAHVIAGECVRAPFVPVISSRGPGSDSIGRTAGMLSWVTSEFGIETVPTGWRLARALGRDMARARGFLSSDLDALEEQFQGFEGSFTLSLVGPVTWAAEVEGASGQKLIRDHGALRELSTALSHVIEQFSADLVRRIPGAAVTIQVDEPLVMPATQGDIPTASALRTYVALDRQFVASLWNPLFEAAQKLGSGFGVNASQGLRGSQKLSDPYISLLRAAGATRFFQVEDAHELGDLIESQVETVWTVPARITGADAARDIAARIGALGFNLSDFSPGAILVPSEVNMRGDWLSARNAWDQVGAAVDLLNDPDRLDSQ